MSRRPREEEKRIFKSHNPHFFKIILNDTIQSGKLVIPRTFMIKYGGKLTTSVQLQVPSGCVWAVELQRSGDDRFWLENGWSDFAKYYSIEHGHFLVFRYEGNSLFHVILFNQTATEIEYPIPIVSENGINDEVNPSTKMKAVEEDRSAEILIDDHFQICRDKRRKPSSSFCHRPSKMMRESSSSAPSDLRNAAFKDRRTRPEAVKIESSKEKPPGGRCHTILKSPYWRRNLSTYGDDKYEVLQRASSHQSTMPFFIALMRSSYVRDSYKLKLPCKFFMKYVPHKEIKLCSDDGKIWSVGLYFGIYERRSTLEVTRGWKAFVKDNGLVVGDACVFELVSIGEASFKVTIFRAKEGSSSVGSLKNRKREVRDECGGVSSSGKIPSSSRNSQSKPLEFKTKYSCFQVIISPAYLNNAPLNIPAKFARSHLKHNAETDVVTLRVGQRTWPVGLILCMEDRKFKKAIFSSGWPVFVKENALELEDVCIFELINSKRMVFQVSILRHGIVLAAGGRTRIPRTCQRY